MGIIEAAAASMKRRGLIEDAKLGAEVAVARAFDAIRRALRAALFLPRRHDTLHVHAQSAVRSRGSSGGSATAGLGALGSLGLGMGMDAPKAAPPLVRSRSAHIDRTLSSAGMRSEVRNTCMLSYKR